MNTKIFLLLLFLLVGNIFPVCAYANSSSYSQTVQQTETEKPEDRFWNWYEKLDEGDRMAARIYIRNVLLGENIMSESLNIFSNKKSHALALSSFIKEAERSPSLRKILICTAYEGGTGCSPNSP